MYRLTKEQKLANLQETFDLKYQKYKNLEKELKDLQAKIKKLKENPTTQTSEPKVPKNQTGKSTSKTPELRLGEERKN